MKCLCKNGQNGDPAWKKSCSWSFQESPWSVSDVKSVQCKARTNQSSTTTTTTTTTTTPTTTTAIQAYPNTHPKCEIKNTLTPCSNCYTYVATITDYFFVYNYETYQDYYDSETYTCTYSISTVCNPNFVDSWNFDNCDKLAKAVCRNGNFQRGYRWLDYGVMTDEGFMTALNCPQCGCTEESGPIRANFSLL